MTGAAPIETLPDAEIDALFVVPPDHSRNKPKSKPPPGYHPRRDATKHPSRSRITNGSAFLPNTDGRNPWVRRAKDLLLEHIQDLGGVDNTSVGERSLARRIAIITVELENLEDRFAQAGKAEPQDLALYMSCANTLRRLFEAVGLQRRARDISVPSVAEYMAHKAKQLNKEAAS
jgi:hypothetical protein